MQTSTVHETHPDTITPAPQLHRPDAGRVVSSLRRRRFATLATSSPAGVPHVAGVLYEIVGDEMWINTLRSSRKARNVAAGRRVAVTVPIRRMPVGPPSSVQFQSTAEVLGVEHPDVESALAAGGLASLTSHGELDLPDTCFVRIPLPSRLPTYGLGMSLWSLIRHPLGAAGEVRVEAWT